MNVTAVNVHLENHSTLRAYCEVELDGEFVLKQVKIVEKNGRFIVGMPSKQRSTPCTGCHTPSSILYEFCPACGKSQGPQEPRIEQIRKHSNIAAGDIVSFYSDLFHPINAECRGKIERAVLAAYRLVKEEAENGPPATGAAGHDAG